MDEQVERFTKEVLNEITRTSDIKVLLITREDDMLRFHNASDSMSSLKVMRLGGLSREEALSLFEGVDVSDESMGVILDMTKGNPLALTIVFSDEVNRLVDELPDLSVHEALILRCLKAMDIVLSG